MNRQQGFWRDRRGASAVEFALLAPLFATLIFGMINISIALWGAAALHQTVDAAARCQAVLTGTCDNNTDTIAWAGSHYDGPNIGPTFTVVAKATCPAAIKGAATYQLHAVLINVSIPLTATACFPAQT